MEHQYSRIPNEGFYAGRPEHFAYLQPATVSYPVQVTEGFVQYNLLDRRYASHYMFQQQHVAGRHQDAVQQDIEPPGSRHFPQAIMAPLIQPGQPHPKMQSPPSLKRLREEDEAEKSEEPPRVHVRRPDKEAAPPPPSQDMEAYDPPFDEKAFQAKFSALLSSRSRGGLSKCRMINGQGETGLCRMRWTKEADDALLFAMLLLSVEAGYHRGLLPAIVRQWSTQSGSIDNLHLARPLRLLGMMMAPLFRGITEESIRHRCERKIRGVSPRTFLVARKGCKSYRVDIQMMQVVARSLSCAVNDRAFNIFAAPSEGPVGAAGAASAGFRLVKTFSCSELIANFPDILDAYFGKQEA